MMAEIRSATIRDSLYDLIPLSAADIALMETAEFLRLDRIQQLGFVSKVWPGAKHSRFEHSLGVYHLMRQAIAALERVYGASWVSEDAKRTAGAAALLHDVGHYPFSHAIEELGSPVRSHEEVGRRIIERNMFERMSLSDQMAQDLSRSVARVERSPNDCAWLALHIRTSVRIQYA